MERFKIICNNCGSENVEVYEDSDYTFDGENEYLVGTGTFVLNCLDCDNQEEQ